MNIYKYKRDRYGIEEIIKLIRKRKNAILTITKNNLLMNPYLNEWIGLRRILVGNWNFAVRIRGNTITLLDAKHGQNMTNNPEILEVVEKKYENPRITNITFPIHLQGNPYRIRCDIDGEWAGMKEISKEEYEKGQIDKEYAIRLIEKYYTLELEEERFKLDEFHEKGRKPQ